MVNLTAAQAAAQITPTPNYAAGQGYAAEGAPITKNPTVVLSGNPTPTPLPTPTPSPTPIPTPSGGSSPTGSDTPDGSYLLSQEDSSENFLLNPTGPDNLEDQEYAKGVKEAGPLIDASNQAYDAQIEQEKEAGQQTNEATGASLVAAGLNGSTAAAGAMGAVNEKNANAVNAMLTQRGAAVQTILDNVRATAQSNSRTDAANAVNMVKTLGQNYVAMNAFKSTFPDEYNHLLSSFGGDENALLASGAISAPKVLSSYVQGNNYVQTVQDPTTGDVKAQTFALSVTPPVGWTSEKLTNAIVFTDPNNAANSITYTTDPLTGALTVNGSGSGLQTLAAAGVQPNSSGDNNSTGATATSTQMASTLGVSDPTVPLSNVVSSTGLGNIVSAIIQNEGGSPNGVNNNPGNIKFVGSTGQIDSGVKATDGGTFASYSTPQEGQQAIGNLVNEAAGKGTSFQDFINSYTGQNVSNNINPTTGLNTKEYGLLANVPGFDPTKPGLDQSSFNYLNQILTQGKTPTPQSVGVSTRTGSGQVFNQIAQRADDLYFKATGQHLPNTTTLAANLGLIQGNNSLLNSLGVQEQTIKANSDLMQKNITADNINQNAPAINSIIDFWQNKMGSPGVASYLAQNSTLSNELGSLLALKNASGTTVHDKLISADLISPDASATQEAGVVNTLMQEAQNARRAIGRASADLYTQTDPLGLDPANPVNAPGYQEAASLGFTPNYDGTYTSPDGDMTVDGNGNPVQ